MKRFSKNFNQLIDFVQFTHEFQEVVRIARPPYRERLENDAEHSYQLAMVAWFIIEKHKLPFDKEKVLMYALAHDLVEIYAGDTYAYDAKKAESKHEREKKALQKIKKRFPQFKNLVKNIETFEKKKDEESKFVYALDKLLPPLQVYLEGGKFHQEQKLAFDTMAEYKNKKIALSKHIDVYWQELLKEFTKNKRKYFWQEK